MSQPLLDDLEHEKLKKAGFGLRLRATLLDGILLLIAYSFCALFLFILSYTFAFINFELGAVIFYTICVLYNPLMESSAAQGSLGKQVFNLKVVDKDENKLSFGHALVRLFAKVLSFSLFLAGFIMIGLSDKKEGLHDMITKTTVISTQKN